MNHPLSRLLMTASFLFLTSVSANASTYVCSAVDLMENDEGLTHYVLEHDQRNDEMKAYEVSDEGKKLRFELINGTGEGSVPFYWSGLQNPTEQAIVTLSPLRKIAILELRITNINGGTLEKEIFACELQDKK